jgi:hypothetical protein
MTPEGILEVFARDHYHREGTGAGALQKADRASHHRPDPGRQIGLGENVLGNVLVNIVDHAGTHHRDGDAKGMSSGS